MGASRLEELLPWRHPFLLIDRLIECVPHQRISATKAITGDDFLSLACAQQGALLPGVIVLEGLNQTAALLFRITYGKGDPGKIPVLGYLRARFSGSAKPGDSIIYQVRAVKMTPERGLFQGEAQVDGATIVEGELALAMADAEAVLGHVPPESAPIGPSTPAAGRGSS